MPLTNKTLRFLEPLADGSSLPCYMIAYRSGLTARDCSRIAARLVKRNQVSRTKRPGVSYHYSLNEQQLWHYQHVTKSGRLETTDVREKLEFLIALKGSTRSRVLEAIIDDYRGAHDHTS